MGILQLREKFLDTLKTDPPPVPKSFELKEESIGPWLARHFTDEDMAMLEDLEHTSGEESVARLLHGVFVEAGLCHPTRRVK
jgi:hypothetical protein